MGVVSCVTCFCEFQKYDYREFDFGKMQFNGYFNGLEFFQWSNRGKILLGLVERIGGNEVEIVSIDNIY